MTVVRSGLTGLLRFAGILFYYLGLAKFVIRLRRTVPRVVAYHASEPTEGPFTRGLECNTSPALLAKHLAFFSTHYQVVPLASIVAGAPERALAITFDDAYRSVYEYALPILREYQSPATVFVVTDAIDKDELIWVNELTWLLNTGAGRARRAAATILGANLDAPIGIIVERARERCAMNGCRDLLDAVSQAAGVRPPAGNSRLYLSWLEAAEMSRVGISFGNHTATHPDLARLDVAAQQEEITRASLSLEANLPSHARISALAYPFGAYGANTPEAVAACGMRVMLTIGGSNQLGKSLHFSRTPVGRASVARLFADLEIVEPAKALLRRMFSRRVQNPGKRRRHWHSPTGERRVPGAPQV